MAPKILKTYKFPDREIQYIRMRGWHLIQEVARSGETNRLLNTRKKEEAEALYDGIVYGASLTYKLFRKERLEDHPGVAGIAKSHPGKQKPIPVVIKTLKDLAAKFQQFLTKLL